MRVFLRLALVAPLIAGCSLDIGSIDELSGEFSITEQDLINANNEFAFKIFRELVAQSDADENIFISPMSIAMALTMTYNGARGATRDSKVVDKRIALPVPERLPVFGGFFYASDSGRLLCFDRTSTRIRCARATPACGISSTLLGDCRDV